MDFTTPWHTGEKRLEALIGAAVNQETIRQAIDFMNNVLGMLDIMNLIKLIPGAEEAIKAAIYIKDFAKNVKQKLDDTINKTAAVVREVTSKEQNAQKKQEQQQKKGGR
jgi:hypothetical protein